MRTIIGRFAVIRVAPAIGVALLAALDLAPPAAAYPPAVGVLGKARNCLECHSNNGPWKQDEHLVLDLLDKETGASVRQPDGSFLVSAKAGQKRALLAVIGRGKGDPAPPPKRNGWIFIDPAQIPQERLGSKFAPGWEVDLGMSCRLTGDALKGREGAVLTVLPMTVRPAESAGDAEAEWQVLMTSGEAVKGDAKSGLTQNYFERRVRLRVEREGRDPPPRQPQ